MVTIKQCLSLRLVYRTSKCHYTCRNSARFTLTMLQFDLNRMHRLLKAQKNEKQIKELPFILSPAYTLYTQPLLELGWISAHLRIAAVYGDLVLFLSICLFVVVFLSPIIECKPNRLCWIQVVVKQSKKLSQVKVSIGR